jgi:hypothetical protein
LFLIVYYANAHVPVPVASTEHASGPERVTEASYFEQEILNPAALVKREDKAETKLPATTVKGSLTRAVFDQDRVLKDEALGSIIVQSPAAETRPSMETYKSIFEPQSENETDLDSADEEKETNHEEMTTDGDPNLRQEPEATSKGKMDANSSNTPLEEKETDLDEVPAVSEAGKTAWMKSYPTSIVSYREHKKKKRKKAKKHKSRERDRMSGHANSDADSKGSQRQHRMKQSRSSRATALIFLAIAVALMIARIIIVAENARRRSESKSTRKKRSLDGVDVVLTTS